MPTLEVTSIIDSSQNFCVCLFERKTCKAANFLNLGAFNITCSRGGETRSGRLAENRSPKQVFLGILGSILMSA